MARADLCFCSLCAEALENGGGPQHRVGESARLQASSSWKVGEGFPLAAPSTSVLQTTRRFTRYWALRQQVGLRVRPMLGLTAHAAGHPYSGAFAAGLQCIENLLKLCCMKAWVKQGCFEH